MKSNVLTNLLLGLVIAGMLATAGLALYYVQLVGVLNRLQFQAALVNRNRALLNAMAAEALEYSKRDPSLEPVLQSIRIKSKASSNAAPVAAKP